jgi:hypothetical protein
LKALDKGYNFVSNLIAIKGLNTKLYASKVVRIPVVRISGLPLGSPNCENFGAPTWESRDKKPFGCGPRGEL